MLPGQGSGGERHEGVVGGLSHPGADDAASSRSRAVLAVCSNGIFRSTTSSFTKLLSADRKKLDVVVGEAAVDGDDREALGSSLGDEHPVKGVGVMSGQSAGREGVGRADRQ